MAESSGFPLEIISNIASLVIVIGIFYKFFQYKKKMEVLGELLTLKKEKQLTADDEEFVKENVLSYEIQLQKDKALIKFAYPFFILLAGLLLFAFETKEALIHINIIVVAFIYLYISKIHTQNFLKILKDLKS